MKKILLIKLTSIGDLIHALPALSDAVNMKPHISFDWVIDENFSEVARWHGGVNTIFTTNHRKWRKNLFKSIPPIFKLIRSIRKEKYDLVIDGQGNFKSALLALCTRGVRAGFDRHSAREWISSIAYNHKFPASKKSHAIDRLRQLFSLSLKYPLPNTEPNFAIQKEQFTPPNLKLPSTYLVFIHSAAWESKLWPESHGKKLMKILSDKGYSVLLPWGKEEEKKRAERLAVSSQIKVLPKLSLSEIGWIIAHAEGCISMDTGLSHLSGALSIPTVTLYGPTDARIIGSSGKNQLHIQAALPCSPCAKKKCPLPSSTSLNPPCLSALSPDQVFQNLEQMLTLSTCNKLCGSYKEK